MAWSFLYLAFVLLPAHAQGIPSANCSREDSRQARHVLEQFLFQHLDDAAARLPPDCPLHPGLDMFREQERHKTRKNKDQHKCGYCGKVFKAEPFLDKHLQKKHADRIPEGATSCLASYCDSLHCEWFKLRNLQLNSRAQIGSKRARLGTQCVPLIAAANRQSCYDLAEKCFPVQTPERAIRTSHHHGLKEPFEHQWDTARDFFVSYFCEAVTCNLPQRDALLEHVVRSSTLWSRWRGQVVLLVVLLAMFYAGLYVWWWVSNEQQKIQRRYGHQSSAGGDDPAGKLHKHPPSRVSRHIIPPVGRMGMASQPHRLQGSQSKAAAESRDAQLLHSSFSQLHHRQRVGPTKPVPAGTQGTAPPTPNPPLQPLAPPASLSQGQQMPAEQRPHAAATTSPPVYRHPSLRIREKGGSSSLPAGSPHILPPCVQPMSPPSFSPPLIPAQPPGPVVTHPIAPLTSAAGQSNPGIRSSSLSNPQDVARTPHRP